MAEINATKMPEVEAPGDVDPVGLLKKLTLQLPSIGKPVGLSRLRPKANTSNSLVIN